MTPIDPSELSAFLDGEVSPDRAREIEAMLATDAALREEFEALANADAVWRSAGREAAFAPAATAPIAEPVLGWPLAIGLIALLAAFKLVTKLGDGLALWLFVHAVVLTVFLIGFARFATQRAPHET